MNIINNRVLFALFLVVAQRGYTQGFINLDFESAIVTLAGGPNIVYASNAIPGWTAYNGPSNNPTESSSSGPAGIIYYNTESLGGALVALEDRNAVYGPLPIQGQYSVLLEGSIPDADSTASIGQTGTIPVTAQSLTFLTGLTGIGGLGLLVSFNGQNLSCQAIGTGANYTVYGADISAFAGRTGQLLFTAPVQNGGLLDNIQFSNLPVPEPGVFGLSALGALLLGWRVLRKR